MQRRLIQNWTKEKEDGNLMDGSRYISKYCDVASRNKRSIINYFNKKEEKLHQIKLLIAF